jgi:riboflavin kinase / FMN adenylyltransferase
VQVEQELAGFAPNRDSLVTIGVFDGVHLGHRYLISQLKELASQQDLSSVVITFDRHPQEVITPLSQPPFLTDADEKAALLKKEGPDAVIVLTFDSDLSHLSARQFVTMLQNRLRLKGLVVGPDFALGHGGEGNIPYLRKLGAEMGFSVTVIPPVRCNGDVISSTAIRKAMANGDMDKVGRLMGRFFSLHGKVVHGKGRGVSLGFPTVNLDVLSGQALPPDGVYATRAYIGERVYLSVTNIGLNPTFGDIDRSIEAFLFDLHENLYEKEVKIEFLRKIRNEVKFNNPDELVKQIYKDIKQAREILKAKEKSQI